MTGTRIFPDVLLTTVKIISRSATPGKDSVGSGFFVSCPASGGNPDDRYIFLVTNKHVIGNWNIYDGNIQEFFQSLILMCYGKESQSIVPYYIEITDSGGRLLSDRVLLHPDQTVDVAIVFLPSNILDFGKLQNISFDLDSYLVPFGRIVDFLTGVGDQVFALGYPLGITSLNTSHPIAKSGYLSTHPGEFFAIELGGKNRYFLDVVTRVEAKILVVDGLIVNGNSGGPIILPADLRIRRNPDHDNRLEFASENLRNFVIGIVSMNLMDSGLTLVYATDYIAELIKNFLKNKI